MITFERNSGVHQSKTFWRWLQENPEGFFVNIVSPRSALIHRGSCWHMHFANPAQVNFLGTEKWCGAERAELERTAEARGIALRACTSCI